jgi:hypothetical protein
VVVGKLGGDAAFTGRFDSAPVIIASYSGGYQAAACFVARTSGVPERVRPVYMLDSLYGSKGAFVTWIKGTASKSIFVSLAFDHGSSKDNTWPVSRDLLSDVGGNVGQVANVPPKTLAVGDTVVYKITRADHPKIPIVGPPTGPLAWFLTTLPWLAPVTPAPAASGQPTRASRVRSDEPGGRAG